MARRRRTHHFILPVVAAILIAFAWGYFATDDISVEEPPEPVVDVKFYIYVFDYQEILEYDFTVTANGTELWNGTTETTKEKSPNRVALKPGEYNIGFEAVNDTGTIKANEVLYIKYGIYLFVNIQVDGSIGFELFDRSDPNNSIPGLPSRDTYKIQTYSVAHKNVSLDFNVSISVNGQPGEDFTPGMLVESIGSFELYSGTYTFSAVVYNTSQNKTLFNQTTVVLNATTDGYDLGVIIHEDNRIELIFIKSIGTFKFE